MIGGVHKSWTNKFNGNVNYGFLISFEDGTTGTCGSEKTVYPLSVGTEVTYEISTNASGRNNITKISKVEYNGNAKPNGNANGKSTFNDPVTVKKIAFSMCQTIARMFFTNKGKSPRTLDDINGLAAIFYNWVLGNVMETDPHFRDLISRRYYALQLSVESIQFKGLGIETKEQVMEAAEVLLEPLTVFEDEPQF